MILIDKEFHEILKEGIMKSMKLVDIRMEDLMVILKLNIRTVRFFTIQYVTDTSSLILYRIVDDN